MRDPRRPGKQAPRTMLVALVSLWVLCFPVAVATSAQEDTHIDLTHSEAWAGTDTHIDLTHSEALASTDTHIDLTHSKALASTDSHIDLTLSEALAGADSRIGLTLSEALAMAKRHGPGFAEAQLESQARHLETALTDARTSPVLTVGGRTELQPDVRQNLNADLQWDFHENLALRIHFDTARPPGAPGSERLSLTFSRKLWPRSASVLNDRMEELEERITYLNELHTAFDAHMAVLEAFAALDQAIGTETTAAAQLELAVARTRIAEDGFTAGDRGLKEYQDAQQAERQALVAHRHAATARSQAALRLQRLLGAPALDKLRAAMGSEPSRAEELGLPVLILQDDLAWSQFVADVQDELAAAGQGGPDLWLASDVAYLAAELVELRAVAARDQARSDRGLQWEADAAYSVSLSGSGHSLGSGSPPGAGSSPGLGSPAGSGPSLGSAAPAGDGPFTAFINASWTWGAAGGLRVEQAELDLAVAELRTRAARQSAVDAVNASIQALDDAAFAREVAGTGLTQALAVQDLVSRRAEFGFVGPLEMAEARLGVLRARAELSKSLSAWHRAWLDLGRRLGIAFPASL